MNPTKNGKPSSDDLPWDTTMPSYVANTLDAEEIARALPSEEPGIVAEGTGPFQGLKVRLFTIKPAGQDPESA